MAGTATKATTKMAIHRQLVKGERKALNFPAIGGLLGF
jgi:hypothetical protein